MKSSNRILESFETFLPHGSTILELGTGAGTKELAEHYAVLSVENEPKYWTGHSKLLHVPLLPVTIVARLFWKRFPREEVAPWYDPDILHAKLKGEKYDAIFIDGPAGTNARIAMWYWYDKLFDMSVPVIIDDLHRSWDMKVATRICHLKQQPVMYMRDMHVRRHHGVIL